NQKLPFSGNDCREPENGNGRMKHCLIVDDPRGIRKVSRRIVESFESEVSEGEKGRDALDKCGESMPDLILLDWNMPVMNGIEFIAELRRLNGGSRPKVVFCTTENDVAHIREAIEAGADEYVMKPFDHDTLQMKLQLIGAAYVSCDVGAAPNIAVRDRSSQRVDPVRVLVVDDSPTVRAVFARLIGEEADLRLVAAEESAERAIAAILTSAPDVILLDLDMPGMGGLHAIPTLIELAAPARVLVVSSLTVRGADHTLAALSLGAADTFAKPRPGKFDKEYRATLLRKIRLLGRVAKRARQTSATPSQPLRPAAPVVPHVLAIGASTGGIHALGQLLGALTDAVDIPILITQHLPGSFMAPFVRQLQAASGRGATVAREGMALLPGQILVAPGDAHLTVAASRAGVLVVRLDDRPAPSGCCPSVDPML